MGKYLDLISVRVRDRELSERREGAERPNTSSEKSEGAKLPPLPSPEQPKEPAAALDPWAALQVTPKRFDPWAAHQGDKAADGQCPICEGYSWWVCLEDHNHCEQCYPIGSIVCKLFFRYTTQPDDLQAGKDIAAGKMVGALPEPIEPLPF